ncbi:hypothetical protein BH10PSE19_BH10PSE19_15150 [soil metagenome]
MAINNKKSQWGGFSAYFTGLGVKSQQLYFWQDAELSPANYAYSAANTALQWSNENNSAHTIQSMEVHSTELKNHSVTGKVFLSKSEQEKLELSMLGDKFFHF